MKDEEESQYQTKMSGYAKRMTEGVEAGVSYQKISRRLLIGALILIVVAIALALGLIGAYQRDHEAISKAEANTQRIEQIQERTNNGTLCPLFVAFSQGAKLPAAPNLTPEQAQDRINLFVDLQNAGRHLGCKLPPLPEGWESHK